MARVLEMKQTRKIRVNFEVDEATLARLKKLKAQTGAKTYAAVFKNALKDHEVRIENGKHYTNKPR